jgi:hypothetical protein
MCVIMDYNFTSTKQAWTDKGVDLVGEFVNKNDNIVQ